MKLLWLALALVALTEAQEKQPVPTTTETTTTAVPKDATYWITMSRKLRPGHPLKLNVQILSGSDPVSVSVTIKDYAGKTTLLTSPVTDVYPGAVQTIEIDIPMDFRKPSDEEWGPNMYQVNVQGRGRTVSFSEDTTLNYEEKSFSLFVQTDKAIYKPGQTVKFRVLGMMPDMKVIRNESMDVIIEDSKGNKIKQYLDVKDPNGRGVVELTFSLADHVPTGDWNIEVTMLGLKETKAFTVDDYVLPKFEVEVNSPPFAVTYDPVLPVTIKATYTFGQPVTKGRASVAIRFYQSWNPTNEYSIQRQGELNEDGEFKFEVSTKQLLDQLKKQYTYYTNLQYTTWEISANVTEGNTGRVQSGTNTVPFYTSPMKMEFLAISPNNFKPGLSYTGYLEVKKQDDTLFSAAEASTIKVTLNVTYEVPLTKDEQEQIRLEREREMNITSSPSPDTVGADGEAVPKLASDVAVGRFVPGFIYVPSTKTMVLDFPDRERTVPDNGFITVTFDVPAEASSVNIKAEGQKPYDDVAAYQYLSKSESPTSSYIQLKVPTEKPKVDSVLNIRAESTDFITKLQYQVYSKGTLVLSDTVTSSTPGGSKALDFSFTVTQAMAPSMSLVAFYMREENEEFVVDAVSISVDGLFQKPVTIEFSKDKVKPGEQVEVIVKAEEDSVVYILAVDKSVQLLKSGNDITQDTVREELVQYDYGGYFPMYRYMFICGWPSYFGGNDPASVFESANVVILTDGLVYRRQYIDIDYVDDVGIPIMFKGDAAGAQPPAAPEEAAASADFQSPERTRKFFPENWLWQFEYMAPDSNGQVVMNVTAPDTITSWVASVFSAHPDFGLSVAKEPAVLTTFRDMFVSLDLPLSIIRDEDYCFTASVFSYYPGELPVLLTLDKSDSFSNIHVKLDGNSVSVSKENLYYSYFLGYLEANDVVSSKFCFTPNVIGDIPVKVSALTNVAGLSDAVEMPLRVKPEGVPRSSSRPYLIDLSSGTWDQQVIVSYPTSTVQGSQRLTVSIAGNLLGPMFENLDDLLKQPYGCGEQNMLNFAPNTYLLEFFYSTNTMKDDILRRSQEYMLSGYQQEITYEHATGGFSAFGDRSGSDDKASLWLTAFVTRCFAQAVQVNNKHGVVIVDIDLQILSRSATWMIGSQNENGSFTEYGKVFHKEMQGGSAEGEALTAYTIIALHEASQVLPTDATIQNSINKAAEFLAGRISTLTDPYDICIVAYTLHLINHRSKEQIYTLMENKAIAGDGMKYWERANSAHSELTSYSWSASADSISIEMTSYALLTYALRGIESSSGLPIVRWMSNQRGPNGGFISTQDTVVGLQALTKVAAKLYTSEDIPMTVTVSYTDGDGQSQSNVVKINKANEMLLQSMEIPYVNNAPSSVLIYAVTDNGQSGPSTVIAEVILNYNVQQETLAQVYDMSHTLETVNSGFVLTITIRTVTSEPSSMTVLEVDIPAGHSPDTEALADNKQISMIEVLEDKLVLYFDTDVIDMKGVKVKIAMVQTGGVLTKPQPRSYRVYDYYEKAKEQTKTYTMEKSDMCSMVPTFGVCQYV